MENNYGLDIPYLNETTNKDVNINFVPKYDVTNYKYRIIKNGEISDYIVINNSTSTSFFLNETGIYQIEIVTYDNYNTPTLITSGNYVIDKENPILEVEETSIEIPLGNAFKIMEGVKAYDNIDGDLISKVTTNYESIDFNKKGLKELVYTVSDESGNTSSKTVYINVISNNSISIIIMQLIVFLLGLIIIYMGYKVRKSIKLEKRLSEYSISPITDKNLSILDEIIIYYMKIINTFSKYLEKSAFFTRISKRRDKYVKVVNSIYNRGIDFISEKIFFIIILLIIAVLSKTVQGAMISIYEVIFSFIFGYFLTDIINYFTYRSYRNKLENDLLQAITVMNNAFKSGRSILQAIYLVTEELDGPISNEFKKMYVEINFGLAIDKVFSRFAERIKLEEVTYLTVSLNILSKTGGNIIKVFSSIEKTLFNKKKLKLELRALTGSSKIIVMVLIFLPIFFVTVIYLLNPNYFLPFINTGIGIILLLIMLFIYISYIYVIRKIIKVRM